MIEPIAIQMMIEGWKQRMWANIFIGCGLLILDIGMDLLGFPG